VAEDVFKPEFYRLLAAEFQAIVARYFAKHPETFTFKMPTTPRSPFALFTSMAWHDLIARLMCIDATGDVDAGLHHHEPDGPGGHIHNDLNPGWFVGAGRDGRVNLSNPQRCSYYHGPRPGVEARRTVRAVAMLYYLANPPWSPGDGGETGLYKSRDDGIKNPSAVVPPINNTMLLFECTPYSYHGFIKSRNQRNSIIMWLHRSDAEVVERWGEEAIITWPHRK
jgi:hypothetical protein